MCCVTTNYANRPRDERSFSYRSSTPFLPVERTPKHGVAAAAIAAAATTTITTATITAV